MREKIVDIIYEQFALYAQGVDNVCSKGCSTCCTQNVNVTTIEARKILRYIGEKKDKVWFDGVRSRILTVDRPTMTTNGFATACLNGEERDFGTATNFTPCPFLEGGACAIYPVRPFACRGFISTVPCTKDTTALVSDSYAATVTAINQLVEHVGQGQAWGNLFDVLIAISGISVYKEYAKSFEIEGDEQVQARDRTLIAQPLTGFLLTEEDMEQAQPLLDAIFSATINGKTVENILYGN